MNDQHSAVAAFQKGIDRSDGGTSYLGGLGWGYASAGRRDDAREVLKQLTGLRPHGMATHFALIYAALDEVDQALTWLEEAFAEHAPWMVYLKIESRYDNLRSEPRFKELLRRMRFPEETLTAAGVKPTRST